MTRLPRSYFVRSRRPAEGEYRVQVLDGRAVCPCIGYSTHGHCWHERKAVQMDQQNVTEESRALVPIEVLPPAAPLPKRSELDIITFIARRAVAARGMLPANIKTQDEAFAVMVAGWEFGAKPMTALRHIYVINGKTEPDAQLMMGVVKARDPSARFIFYEATAEACDLELERGGKSVVRLRCAIDEVPKMLRDKAGPWQQYRGDMIRWFTVRRVCRLGAPDLINTLGGVNVAEAGDYTGEDEEPPEVDSQAIPVAALVNPGDDPPPAEEPESEEEAAEASPTPESEPTEEPMPKLRNLGDLYKHAHDLLGYPNKAAVLKDLGCTEMEMGDFQAAWRKLAQRKGA
jgi:hypothetical protein